MTPRPAPEEWESTGSDQVSASRGDEAYLRGDFGEAIRLYREDLEGPSRRRTATPAVTWKNYGHALYAEGDIEGAQRAFREAVHRSPPNEAPYGEAQLGVARCLLLRDRFEEAVQAAQAALDSGTTDEAWAAEILGVAQQRMGRFDEADQSYLHAIARGGDGEAAWRARERKSVHTFSVQVGSYRSVKAAGAMQDALRQGGFTPRIVRVERGADLLYRVLVGDLETYAEARALREKIRSEAGIQDALIFP